MPRLFAASSTPVARGTSDSRGVHTPIGEVRFTASADGRDLATGHPDRWRGRDDVRVDRWESAGIELRVPDVPTAARVA